MNIEYGRGVDCFLCPMIDDDDRRRQVFVLLWRLFCCESVSLSRRSPYLQYILYIHHSSVLCMNI